jgi:hypothetical protein
LARQVKLSFPSDGNWRSKVEISDDGKQNLQLLKHSLRKPQELEAGGGIEQRRQYRPAQDQILFNLALSWPRDRRLMG